MTIYPRHESGSIEPELMASIQDSSDEDVKSGVHVCVAVCPLGHDCTTGCFDPSVCSKW